MERQMKNDMVVGCLEICCASSGEGGDCFGCPLDKTHGCIDNLTKEMKSMYEEMENNSVALDMIRSEVYGTWLNDPSADAGYILRRIKVILDGTY